MSSTPDVCRSWRRERGSARVLSGCLALTLAAVLAMLVWLASATDANASPPSPQAVPGTTILGGVACASASSCLAVGQNAAGLDVIVPITNGVAGAATAGTDHVSLNRIACTSASSCVAVGGNQANGEAVVVPITHGALGPAQAVPGAGFLNDVACDPRGACAAVGHTPGPFFTGEGVVVPISGGTAGAPQTVPSTQDLLGVSCPANGSCVSVGTALEFSGHTVAFHGVVVPIEAGVAQAAEPVAGTMLLNDIDCTAPGTCAAAGFTSFFGLAAVPVINGTPGATQSTPDVPTAAEIGAFPSALACPSAQLCLAGGGDNDQEIGAVAPIVGGAPGIEQDVRGTAGVSDLVCLPSATCVAVGQTPGRAGAVLSFPAGSGASASTAVSAEPSAAQFGKAVSGAVTVHSTAGTPTGEVYFAVDGVFGDYPQALDGSGKTSFTINGLAPGSHSITAVYVGPTGAFSSGGTFYQPGSASSPFNVTCSTTITGQQNNNLTITQPATCISGAQVSGSINVQSGVSVSIASSTINNSINANGAGLFRLCASTVANALSVINATGYVLVGDRSPGEDFDSCGANTIRGSMKLTGDGHGVTAIGNSVGSIDTARDSGSGGFPFELAPMLAPNVLLSSGQSTFLASRQNGAKGQTVDGIECNGNEQLVSHYHAHLAIFASGQPLAIPQGVGMVGRLSEFPTPYGPFAFLESGPEETACIYWVHTHDQTGMIHLELPAEFTVTLGDFFDLWGQPLSSSQVGPQAGSVTAFVNGVRYSGNPRNIVLGDHTLVQLDIGGPTVPPQPFEFTATNR